MLSLKTVSGDHDLANIRLHNLQPRESLAASFSLDTLLVAGSCTEGGDGGSKKQKPPKRGHAPPPPPCAGLRVALSGGGSDTLVIQKHPLDGANPFGAGAAERRGYLQLKASPGVYNLSLVGDAFELRGADGAAAAAAAGVPVVAHSFAGVDVPLRVRRLGSHNPLRALADAGWEAGSEGDGDTVHVFSLASGLLYERFLRIMMRTVLQRTKSRVKFWLLANFLSPTFRAATAAPRRRSAARSSSSVRVAAGSGHRPSAADLGVQGAFSTCSSASPARIASRRPDRRGTWASCGGSTWAARRWG